MFSVNEKRKIADAVQKILRDTGHVELPEGEIQFSLLVDGNSSLSYAHIHNNGSEPQPGVNPHNEAMEKLSKPTHSEKGLRELVAKWRKSYFSGIMTDAENRERRLAKEECADELEQALAATPANKDLAELEAIIIELRQELNVAHAANVRMSAATPAVREPQAEYPKPCGLCPGQIESKDDLDWHGLGNCVPICERCTGSGIEPKSEAVREPGPTRLDIEQLCVDAKVFVEDFSTGKYGNRRNPDLADWREFFQQKLGKASPIPEH